MIGCITRTEPTASDHAQLTISLHGRSKSSVKTSSGYSSHVSVGKFSFFDADKTTTRVLHTGKPMTIEPSSSSRTSWPFTITIPLSINHDSVVATGISQEHSYLPLGPDAAAQPIPSTFNFKGGASASFVEYYLQAELQLSSQGKGLFSGRDKIKTYEAILPLQVRHVSSGPPITDFKLQRKSIPQSISSPRLVPGMKDAELSFSQKAQKVLGSSKTPKLTFRVYIDAPTVLQLESESCVPFRVGCEPIWGSTSEEIRGVLQNFTIESLSVRVKPTTDLKVKSRGYRGSAISASYASKEIHLVAAKGIGPLGGNVCIPGDAEGPTDPLLDVGKLVNFNLSGLALRSIAKQPSETKLYPDFTTYNIKRSHQLLWKLHGVIAGEKVELTGGHAVTLLPSLSSADLPMELEVPGTSHPAELETPWTNLPTELEAPVMSHPTELEAPRTNPPTELEVPQTRPPTELAAESQQRNAR